MPKLNKARARANKRRPGSRTQSARRIRRQDRRRRSRRGYLEGGASHPDEVERGRRNRSRWGREDNENE